MATAPVVIEAIAKHSATFIFLHGLGDTGMGWASFIGSIRQDNMKVVCPTAQTMPVTLNAGFRMPSWFDLITLDIDGKEDEAGIKKAAQQVRTLINDEIRAGIPANRILLGGFSQGGALALYTGLNFPEALAGIVSLSGWLPLHKQFAASGISQTDVPVLLCHGDCDPIVPYKWGQLTSAVIKSAVKKVDFKTYRGLTHSSSDDEKSDVKQFMINCLHH